MAETKKQKKAASVDMARPENLTVGEMLRAARVAKGLEISDVSSSIHIRASQLRAIEENNIDTLPGMTYAVGFVRGYANFLGLNGTEIVHKFKAEHGYTPSPSKLSFPEPIVESRMPDPMMIGVGVVMAAVVLVLWSVYSNMQDGYSRSAEQVPPAPVVTTTSGTPAEDVLAAIPPPFVSVVPEVTPALIVPAPAPEVAEPAQAVDVPSPAAAEDTAVVKAPEKPAEIAVTENKPAQEEPVININRGKTRILLQANQASWIQVTDSRGDVIYKKVLRPGDQYYVPDQAGLSLVTANAGGLDIQVDGQKVQALGKPGEIVRGIALDPTQLKKNRTKARDR